MSIKINLPENKNHPRRKLLEKLWFIYGNNGRKSTLANHKWIQNILVYGNDHRDFYHPDDECMQAVEDILTAKVYHKKVVNSRKGPGINLNGYIIRIDPSKGLKEVVVVYHTQPFGMVGIYRPDIYTPIKFTNEGKMKI